jgi:hypothetical protein
MERIQASRGSIIPETCFEIKARNDDILKCPYRKKVVDKMVLTHGKLRSSVVNQSSPVTYSVHCTLCEQLGVTHLKYFMTTFCLGLLFEVFEVPDCLEWISLMVKIKFELLCYLIDWTDVIFTPFTYFCFLKILPKTLVLFPYLCTILPYTKYGCIWGRTFELSQLKIIRRPTVK